MKIRETAGPALVLAWKGAEEWAWLTEQRFCSDVIRRHGAYFYGEDS